MRRGKIIAFVGWAAVAWSLAASAQQPKVVTIGVLVRDVPGSERFWRLFREAMREQGYVEGENVRYEFRSDRGQSRRDVELAARVVSIKPDLIVSWATPATIAVKQATRDIPIVMALTGNPVENGLVNSLARPGGNVTGISSMGAEIAGKTVELTK